MTWQRDKNRADELLASNWSGKFTVVIDSAEWQYTSESWHELKVGDNAFVGSVLDGEPFTASADGEEIGTFPTLVDAKLAVMKSLGMRISSQRWERSSDRAILYFGEVPVADITPFGNGYQVVMGCRVFAPGGISQHATMDEAVRFVDGKVGRSDER